MRAHLQASFGVIRCWCWLPAAIVLGAPAMVGAQTIQRAANATPVGVRADSTFVRVVWRTPTSLPTGYVFSHYWVASHKDSRPLQTATFMAVTDTGAVWRLGPPIVGRVNVHHLTVALVVRTTDTAAPRPRYLASRAQNLLWRRAGVATDAMLPPDTVRPTVSLRFSNPSTARLVIGDSMQIFERRFASEADTIGGPLVRVATISPRDTVLALPPFARLQRYKFYVRSWYSGITLTGDTIPLPAVTVMAGAKSW